MLTFDMVSRFHMLNINMQVFIKIFSFSPLDNTLTIDTEPSMTIKNLKRKIDQKTKGNCNCSHRIVFAGKRLEEEDKTLKEYGIEHETTLHLLGRLAGAGAFHTRAIPGEGLVFYSQKHEKQSIPTFHLSCKSAPVSEWKLNDVAGMLIYDEYLHPDQKLKIRPGYVLVQTVENLEKIKSTQGQVHGKLFKSLFGKEPDELKLFGGGFGRKAGKEWAFVSSTLSATSSPDWQDGQREWNKNEQFLLELALQSWESKGGKQDFDISAAIRKEDEACSNCGSIYCKWPVEFE
jgi:hypothetical protein